MRRNLGIGIRKYLKLTDAIRRLVGPLALLAIFSTANFACSRPEKRLEVIDLPLPTENSRPRTEKITHVVIHFISNVSNNPREPYKIEDVCTIFKEYGASSHYVIGRRGEIYRTVPEDRVAFHAGKGSLPGYPEYKDKLNDYSIGIEVMAIGTREEMLPMITGEAYDLIEPSLIGYTEEQYKSMEALLKDIAARNPSIKLDRKYIIGHEEYAGSRKTDPGSLFDWSKIGF